MTDRSPWSHLVDEQRIGARHQEVLAKYGGIDTPAVTGCIERSLAAAWSAEQYLTREPADVPGLIFAGHLLFYLSQNHCWGDGNGRTALAAVHDVLTSLGLTVDASEDQLLDYVLAIKRGKVRRAGDVVIWIAARLVELQ